MGSRTNAVNKGKQAGSIHGLFVFLKIGQSRLFLFIFVLFSSQLNLDWKRGDAVLEDRTQGCRMVSTDVSAELGPLVFCTQHWMCYFISSTTKLKFLVILLNVPQNNIVKETDHDWITTKQLQSIFLCTSSNVALKMQKSFRIFAPQSTGKYYYCNQQTFTQTLGTAYFLLRQYKLPNCKLFSTRDYFK